MLGALMLASLTVASPRCDSEAMRLDWVRTPAAEACPDGAEVATRIRAVLGCDPFGPEPSLRFEVWVDARDGEWVARVLRLDERGAKIGDTELTSGDEDCGVLAEAVALAVTVVAEPGDPADPIVPTETSSISARASPTTTATVTRRIIIVPAARVGVPAPSTDAPRMSVSAAVAMSSGTLPGPTAGVALGARWPVHRFLRLGADLLVLPTRRWDAYGFGLVAGALGVCPTAPFRRWTVGGCARGYVGSLTSVVYPIAQPRKPGPHVWAGVGGSLFARYSVTSHVFVSAELEGVVATPRRVFEVEEIGPAGQVIAVHSEAPVAFFGRFGVGVRFGE